MSTNWPNVLTLARIALIPLLVAAFYLDRPLGPWLAFAIYVVACATDYLDGALARRLNQGSSFGRILDPIADKLLVAATILMLVSVERAPVLPAVVILCREFLVSGLREYLVEIKVSLPVSKLAKWKTTAQMVAIGLLVVGPAGPTWLTMQAGSALLWLAAALTLITGYDYLRVGLRHMDDKPPARPATDAEPR